MLGAHLGMATGASLYFYTSSLFILPLTEAFGWSRGDIAMGAALGLLGSLTAPFIGRMTDRFGARLVAAVSSVLIALVFAGLSQMTGPFSHFMILSALFGIVAPGMTAMTFSRAVTGWFSRARGQALGVMAAGGSIGALLFTPLIAYVLLQYGTMGGYLALAALTAFLGTPAIILGLKDRASGRKADPDADPDSPATQQKGARSTERAQVIRSLRSRSFIALGFAVFATNVPTSGILTQLEPLLRHNGIAQTAPLISMYAFAVLVGRIGVGWLFDHTDARYTAALVTMTAAGGCLMFMSGAPVWMVIAAILMVGIMQGMEADAIGYFVARQFDHVHFGLLFGFLLTISILGTAVGIVGFGMLYDATQSYDLALSIAAVVLVIAFAGYLSIPRQAHAQAEL